MCLLVFNTTVIKFQVFRSDQFYWWRKSKYREKTPTCCKLLTILSHKVISSTPSTVINRIGGRSCVRFPVGSNQTINLKFVVSFLGAGAAIRSLSKDRSRIICLDGAICLSVSKYNKKYN